MEEDKLIESKKILTDYREDKKALNDIHEIQKKTILEEAEKDIAKIPELENKEVPYGVQLTEKAKNYKENTEQNNAENKNITLDSEDNKIEENSSAEESINFEETQKKYDENYIVSDNIYSSNDNSLDDEDDSIV